MSRSISQDTTLTRCTAKLRTDVLPYEALEAIIQAMTCWRFGHETLVTCSWELIQKTHLLDFEFPRIDQVDSRTKPLESRPLYHMTLWQKGFPENSKCVNDQE